MTPPPTNITASAYLKTKVLSASPEELRLMLLEGAIKFAMQGREGLNTRNFEASFNGFSQARNIVMELINSIRADVDPDLCARVSSLYTYIYTQLVEASFQKDIPKAGKAIELLEYERETWAMLMEQIAKERASGAAIATGNQSGHDGMGEASAVDQSGKPARVALSVQA